LKNCLSSDEVLVVSGQGRYFGFAADDANGDGVLEKGAQKFEFAIMASDQPGDVRVIATGGGAFVDPRTRELLNDRAITVWLDAPVDVLAERTSRRDTRAQLRNGDPKETLERLSQERRESYEEAHIHVKSGDGAHKEVVEAIVEALEKHLTGPAKA